MAVRGGVSETKPPAASVETRLAPLLSAWMQARELLKARAHLPVEGAYSGLGSGSLEARHFPDGEHHFSEGDAVAQKLGGNLWVG